MSNEPASAAKVCKVCKQDCSNRPRQRDKEGRYTCQDCLDKLAKAKGGSKPVGEQSALDPGLAAALKGVDQTAMTACPNCGVLLKPGAVLCTGCGYDLEKGRPLRTRLSVEKGAAGPADAATAKRNKNIVVGIVAIVVLGGATYMILNQMGIV